MIALPQYFDGSAMENWGLIVSDYALALLDENYADWSYYDDLVSTTAHETVHQVVQQVLEVIFSGSATWSQ